MVLTLLGEPVTYAIFKERRGCEPLRLNRGQRTAADRLTSLNAHFQYMPEGWARSDNTDGRLDCQVIPFRARSA